MSLYKSAVSSMNYFFLRKLVDKPYNKVEVINNELENYLTALNNEFPLDQEVEKAIETELIEGDYFTGRTETQVRRMLELRIMELSGEQLPTVVEFYLAMGRRNSLFAEEA